LFAKIIIARSLIIVGLLFGGEKWKYRKSNLLEAAGGSHTAGCTFERRKITLVHCSSGYTL